MNEIKILALFPRLFEYMSKLLGPASIKIYVEKGSNLSQISFAKVIKSLLVDLINRRSRWMVDRCPNESMVNHKWYSEIGCHQNQKQK